MQQNEGCDTFILPPEITKQSPEVWARIVDRHKITCLLTRAREFSWATQTHDYAKDVFSLKSLSNVILLGRVCFNSALSVLRSLCSSR